MVFVISEPNHRMGQVCNIMDKDKRFTFLCCIDLHSFEGLFFVV